MTNVANPITPPAEPPAGAPPGAPDSPVLHEDVACPLCEYNLRGLTEPRCPECGYAFSWPELTDPTRRRHPFLFEHHADRNLRSFLRTLWAGLRPARFWRSLSPAQPSFPGRLAKYVAAVLALMAVTGPLAVVIYLATMLQMSQVTLRWRSAWDVAWDSVASSLLTIGAYYVLWAAGTFGALLVFRISMRRARIRPVHVARCVVYSFDAGLWATLLVLAAALAGIATMMVTGARGPGPIVAGLTVSVPYVLFGVVFYRLTAAYRHYLRFDRPFLTILASQVIAWLFVMNVLLWSPHG